MLSNRWYDILKHVASIGLPALSAFYFTVAQIWGFSDTVEVMATIAAINTLLGGLVGISTLTYNTNDAKYVGTIEITDNGSKKVFSLNLDSSPDDLENMSEAAFRINSSATNGAVQNPPHLGS